MRTLPTMQRLCEHFMRLDCTSMTVWFAYHAPVAFRIGSEAPVVLDQKVPSRVKGFLDKIDGGYTRRLPRYDKETFQTLWENQVQPVLRALRPADGRKEPGSNRRTEK